jgi:prepilin-type N-terminal cleavage/methylation domain-containing protein
VCIAHAPSSSPKPVEVKAVRKIRLHRQQGFTLIELMIVIAIVALLATIAVPTSKQYITKSHYTAALVECKELYNAFIAFYAANDMFPNATSSPKFDLVTFSPLEYDGTVTKRMVGQKAEVYDSPDDLGNNQEFYVRMVFARDPAVQFVVSSSDNVDIEPGVKLNGVFVYRNGIRVK